MTQTAPAAAAVVKALRATEKRMAESWSKNKKKNYSSTDDFRLLNALDMLCMEALQIFNLLVFAFNIQHSASRSGRKRSAMYQ